MRYKHIVFDIDGTLIDTEYAILHSLQETLMDLSGKKHAIDKLTFALGITGADALAKLSVTDIPAALKLWNENMLKYADTSVLFEEIPKLLDALTISGYKLGIVTSKARNEFEYDFSRFEIRHYFDTIICADDTTVHKPFPDPLLKYLEKSGADRNHVLYIGDSIYDSKCAENAEIDFALALWGSQSGTIKAAYYLNKPGNLLSVINDG